jgi:pimeloyl-ACP methyl ester carboxylesterase
MPYIDIVSPDDYVSLWYQTNALYSNVGSFDRAKPTVMMLHPLFLDSTWLVQFYDTRLDSKYNIIAFDMRVCGKSKCRPSALHDSWVEAADLAYAHQVSGLTVV